MGLDGKVSIFAHFAIRFAESQLRLGLRLGKHALAYESKPQIGEVEFDELIFGEIGVNLLYMGVLRWSEWGMRYKDWTAVEKG